MIGSVMLNQLVREVSKHKAYRMPLEYSSKALIYIAHLLPRLFRG